MNVEEINAILDKLMQGELEEYFVKKDDFPTFRQILVKRQDFKNFRGIAQRGGDILFRYLDEPRS